MTWGKVFNNQKLRKHKLKNIPVVIMAGGKGTRLEPFTNVLPKPLIPVQDKTLIEHIMERFTDVGVKNFYLTINHKSRIMKAFFDELNPDYEIKFLEENQPLGTAGSLKFIENIIEKPFLLQIAILLLRLIMLNYIISIRKKI